MFLIANICLHKITGRFILEMKTTEKTACVATYRLLKQCN
jgi:hypothetical protein